MPPPLSYDVSLSFAGEDREYVERVAQALRAANVRVFYDAYEEVSLWGRDLYQRLAEVYSSSRYCVIFVSRSYARKVWPRHELRSAQERALREQREYILPARFDNTEIPGLPLTVAYIDLAAKQPEELANLIIRKLNATDDRAPEVTAATTHGDSVVSVPSDPSSTTKHSRLSRNDGATEQVNRARVRWTVLATALVAVFALVVFVTNRLPSQRWTDQQNCGPEERWVGMRPSRAEWPGYIVLRQADHATLYGELRWTPVVDQVKRTTVGRVELEVDGRTITVYRWNSPKSATHSFTVRIDQLLRDTSGHFKIRWVWEDGTSGVCVAQSVVRQ